MPESYLEPLGRSCLKFGFQAMRLLVFQVLWFLA